MIVAEVNYSRLSAAVELQDAQGWQSISKTPRYRAAVEKIELKALDIYMVIVDKIDLSDDAITDDLVVFNLITPGFGSVNSYVTNGRAAVNAQSKKIAIF